MYKLSRTEERAATLFLAHPDLLQRTKPVIDGVVETPANLTALECAKSLIANCTPTIHLRIATQLLEDQTRLSQAKIVSLMRSEVELASTQQELVASKKEVTTLKRQLTALKKKLPSNSASPEFRELEESAARLDASMEVKTEPPSRAQSQALS